MPQVIFTRTDITLRWIGPGRYAFEQTYPRPFLVNYGSAYIEPRSFKTDLGSIPNTPLLRWLLPPDGFAPAYVAHDWLYSHHERRSRAWADRLLRDGILALGGSWVAAWAVYLAVRIFGGPCWARRSSSL